MKERMISQAVILAGGYGTRLQPFTDTKPKPMYEFEGRPFLEYLLYQIKEFGIKEVVLLLGYLPQIIQEFVGDGSAYGLNVTYDITPPEYDTGTRLKHAGPMIKDCFLLMYCDNYCPMDLEEAEKKFFSSNALVQVTAYANRDFYTKNNLCADENGKVTIYDKSRFQEGLSMVDIGYALVRKEVLSMLPDTNVNFEKAIYSALADKGLLYAFKVEHRYYSVGSWDPIRLTKEFFRPKKIAFLDRDGTLNVRAPKGEYIVKPDQFVWLEGAIDALKLLKENGYTLIIVTNQPGIARGYLTLDTLEQIHEKMQKDLSVEGILIDGIYVCTHGWNDGCFCRKPKPGLLFQAQKDLSLDLSECVLFGDDERDLEAGKAAGCHKVIQVTEENCLKKQVVQYLQEATKLRF